MHLYVYQHNISHDDKILQCDRVQGIWSQSYIMLPHPLPLKQAWESPDPKAGPDGKYFHRLQDPDLVASVRWWVHTKKDKVASEQTSGTSVLARKAFAKKTQYRLPMGANINYYHQQNKLIDVGVHTANIFVCNLMQVCRPTLMAWRSQLLPPFRASLSP